MSFGLAEFDEPEPATIPRSAQEPTCPGPASSAVPPPSRPSSVQGGGVVTPRDLELADPDASFDVRIVNCQGCGTHMELLEDPADPEFRPLCERCIEWASLMHRRDSYVQANRQHRDPAPRRERW